MSSVVGYDRVRLGELDLRTRWAIDAIDGIGSDDPEAAVALSTLAGVRDVLEREWLPTIRGVLARDPLDGAGRVDGPAAARAATSPIARRPRPPHSPARGPLASWSDDDLLAIADRILDDLPLDGDGRPVRTGPAWRLLELLADEIARRTAVDPGFPDLLVERAEASPALTIALGLAELPPPLLRDVALRVLRVTSWVDDHRSRHQALGVELVLGGLLSSPEELLRVLADRVVTTELLAWPLLDPDLRAVVVLSGLLGPRTDPELLPLGQEAMLAVVAAANARRGDAGFDPPVGAAIAASLSLYVPTLITTLGQNRVGFTEADGFDNATESIPYEELLDLFGALLRDPAAAEILLTTLRAAAGRSFDDARFDDHHVALFAAAIADAAANERLEEELRVATQRSLVGGLVTILGLMLGAGAVAERLGPMSVRVLREIVRRSGPVAGRTIRPSDPDALDDVGALATIVVELALYEEFLADPGRHVRPDAHADAMLLAGIAEGLGRVEAMLLAGADPDEVIWELRAIARRVGSVADRDFFDALRYGPLDGLARDEVVTD